MFNRLRRKAAQLNDKLLMLQIGCISFLSTPANAQDATIGFEKQLDDKIGILTTMTEKIGYSLAFLCIVGGIGYAMLPDVRDRWGAIKRGAYGGLGLSMAQLAYDFLIAT